MYVLYPAGPEWSTLIEATQPASDVALRLAEQHGFVRGSYFEPFGAKRGAVIAQRDMMLVMAVHTDIEAGRSWYAIAPALELQYLVWSFSNGYTKQWSARELKALTGHETWEGVLQLARAQFSAAVRSLNRALHGFPEIEPEAPRAASVAAEITEDFGSTDLLAMAAAYFESAPEMEVGQCVR
jgi:hypothetical protein